jgi:hypothetical protein
MLGILYMYEGQHGFRPGYLCESQVITVRHDVSDSLDEATRLDAIIIDVSKAFDLRGSFQKFCTLYVFSLKMYLRSLQHTFTGLQCNLHCALSQRSNVWESLVFLSGRLRC